jgi:hypothetical protein
MPGCEEMFSPGLSLLLYSMFFSDNRLCEVGIIDLFLELIFERRKRVLFSRYLSKMLLKGYRVVQG